MQVIRFLPVFVLSVAILLLGMATDVEAARKKRYQAHGQFREAQVATVPEKKQEDVKVAKGHDAKQLSKRERIQKIRDAWRSLLVKNALSCRGIPYKWGGTSVNGFDCSGFVQYVYHKAGIKMPRLAKQMAGMSNQIGKIRPGDVVAFTSKASPTGYHVGIFLGKMIFIHAPQTGDVIRLERLDNPKYLRRFIGAYSPFSS